jgi:hypothetical protein
MVLWRVGYGGEVGAFKIKSLSTLNQSLKSNRDGFHGRKSEGRGGGGEEQWMKKGKSLQ